MILSIILIKQFYQGNLFTGKTSELVEGSRKCAVNMQGSTNYFSNSGVYTKESMLAYKEWYANNPFSKIFKDNETCYDTKYYIKLDYV